ncbi:MAG: DUF1987 domain-containing protein [Bacteroidales bacterium]|nr:DUF1987 domain-containing protein [Bacteroidales bacterium]MBN2763718.1 DUF1987 domain-containing protein [Bacteroidales bacterium]
MRDLNIQAGRSTPGITYIPEENVLTISGSSLPENVHAFYKPVIEWIDEFSLSPILEPPMRIILKIQYYNSGTIRFLAEMLKMISRLHEKGLDLSVDWYYEADDDIIREAGEELSEILDMQFNMINY